MPAASPGHIPASPQRRRWIGVASGLVVLILAIGTALWWVATARMEAALTSVLANAAQNGWRIETGPPDRAGWPFAATIRLQPVSASHMLAGTTMIWTAASIEATLSPFQPGAVLIAVTGQQTVSLGTGPALPLKTEKTTLLMPLAGGPAILELRDLIFTLQGGPALRLAHLRAEAETLTTALTADGIAFDKPLQPPFDGPMALSASLHLTAVLPFAATPDPLSPASSVQQWQQAGGRLEVPAITVHWGPLQLTGSGDFGLDAQLQPQGRARLDVVGAAEALDAAGRAGLLAAGPEAAARAVLSLLALASTGGARPPHVALQATLTGRTLTVARFPLLRLPFIDWNVP